MARPREVPGLDCDEAFALSATRVIAARSEDVFRHSGRVLDLDDVEPVHDMRVATRRLRAAMEMFEPCFRPKRYRKAMKGVKKLADALGERRDRDVAIAQLEELAMGVPEGDRERVEAIVARLREEQAGANEDLAPFVSKKRLQKLRRRLRRLEEGTRP